MTIEDAEVLPPVSALVSTDVAAVDLGSNSFHMLVARVSGTEISVVDRLREPVRLAAGLDDNKRLSPEAAARALACLQRFGQRLRDLPEAQVRVVGTNTLRRMRKSGAFVRQAQEALGHPIEIISGIEEARLIYGGVVHGLGLERPRRMVVDIGGGSTELIIGDGTSPRLMESTRMGCVAYSERFFGDGKISKRQFERARLAARIELEFLETTYREAGWDVCLGASGTIRSIAKVIAAETGSSELLITPDGLATVIKRTLRVGRVSKLDFDGLREDRRPIFAGGLAVLAGIFDALNIQRMMISDRALREGAIYDLLGRLADRDVRDATVMSLVQRYGVDARHSGRVRDTGTSLYMQVASSWGIDDTVSLRMIGWAAELHEIGLTISHSSYHKHGGYLLKHADLDGFSQTSQRLLAAIVRLHRGKFREDVISDLPDPWPVKALGLTVLLRLAAIMHRARLTDPVPTVLISGSPQEFTLALPSDWLDAHPLTVADLEREQTLVAGAGIEFSLEAI